MVWPCFLALVVMSHWLLDIMCEKWGGSEWRLLLPERVLGSLARSYQRWRWLRLDFRIWEGWSPSGMFQPLGVRVWNLDSLPETPHPTPASLVSPELQFLLSQNQETAHISDCLCILLAVTLCLRSQLLSLVREQLGNRLSRMLSPVLHGLLLSGILALESCLPRLSSKFSQCLEVFWLFFSSFHSCPWQKNDSDTVTTLLWPEAEFPFCILPAASCRSFYAFEGRAHHMAMRVGILDWQQGQKPALGLKWSGEGPYLCCFQCVTLSGSLDLLRLQFCHLQNGSDDTCAVYLIDFVWGWATGNAAKSTLRWQTWLFLL